MIREVLQSGARDDPVGATWDGGAQCIATNSLLKDLSRSRKSGVSVCILGGQDPTGNSNRSSAERATQASRSAQSALMRSESPLGS